MCSLKFHFKMYGRQGGRGLTDDAQIPLERAYISFFYLYFQEITLWRKGEKTRKLIQDSNSPNMPSHLVSGGNRREKNLQNIQNSSNTGRGDGPVEDMTRESPTLKDSNSTQDFDESSPQ